MGENNGHILVVDDNRLNRLMIARGLEQQGHSVELAEHGRQALDMLQVEPFDLVLLDIMMPEMDGYQVLERMKGDQVLRDIPVVVISAVDEMESVVRCIEMGAEDYLPKPFDPVLLRARISAGLEKKRMRDQEVEYLRNVALLTDAAAAVQAEAFDPGALAEVAARTDALGQLARVFQHMAREVYAREQRLKQQVQELRIELDEAKKARQVAEITETEYFRELQARVRELRGARSRRKENPTD
jgi:two-component system cell cycle response regulator